MVFALYRHRGQLLNANVGQTVFIWHQTLQGRTVEPSMAPLSTHTHTHTARTDLMLLLLNRTFISREKNQPSEEVSAEPHMHVGDVAPSSCWLRGSGCYESTAALPRSVSLSLSSGSDGRAERLQKLVFDTSRLTDSDALLSIWRRLFVWNFWAFILLLSHFSLRKQRENDLQQSQESMLLIRRTRRGHLEPHTSEAVVCAHCHTSAGSLRYPLHPTALLKSFCR